MQEEGSKPSSDSPEGMLAGGIVLFLASKAANVVKFFSC
jgi:hypothetical protein